MSIAAKMKTAYEYDPVHLIGVVESVGDEAGYRVRCDGYEWHCKRAASCLLAPEVGDTVLVSGPDHQRVYLLAVIEQANPAASLLQVPGQLRVSAGKVDIESQGGIAMQSGQALTLESVQLNIQSDKGMCVVNEMEYLGKKVTSTVGFFHFIGNVYESIVERLSQMSRSSFRVTEGVEQVRAGMIDFEAEKTARVHSKYTVVTAEDLIKVDGKQIHMG
ncbi:MAG: DUF3540 domain-containing protein [Advenella sp.]|nr:DUF3540 domain-containing protein [Advenella sp.]